MKYIFSLLLITAFTTITIHAQKTERPNFLQRHSPRYQKLHPVEVNYYKRYTKLKTAGIVLTGFGIAAEAIAISMKVSGAREVKQAMEAGARTHGFKEFFGEAGIYGGIAAIGGGITQWVIANNKLKKLKAAGTSINITLQKVQLVYTF